MTDNDQASVEALTRILDEQERVMPSPHPTQAEKIRAILDAIRKGEVPGVYCGALYDAQLQANAKLRAEAERLRGELIPVGWEVLEQSGCPRCGDDVVAEPAMDGDGFLDGNPARCQSCGLPGQVTVDDEGAHFSADDRQWEIDAEAKRADKATAERDRLAGLLAESRRRLQGFYRNPPAQPIARDLLIRIDAALAEIGGGK